MPKKITSKIYEDVQAKEFYVPVFNQYYYMLFGKENWRKLCTYDTEFAEYVTEGDNNGHVAFNTESNRIYVWFKDETMAETGTLAHECVHLAKAILKCRGMEHTDEELIAHLVGHTYKEMRPHFA